MANECLLRSEQEVRDGILHTYRVMKGVHWLFWRVWRLPGPLKASALPRVRGTVDLTWRTPRSLLSSLLTG